MKPIESGPVECPVVPIPNGPLASSKPPKKSWAQCFPLCPECGEPMARDGKRGWKCFISEGKKRTKGCGGTDSTGSWRVEFMPRVPTLNQLQRIRINELTLETWPNEEQAEARVAELDHQWKQDLVVPSRRTWLSSEQCRGAEHFLIHNKYSLEQLKFSERLLNAIETSSLKSPEELIHFLDAHKVCGIPCSINGMVKYCTDTRWCGDLIERPTFVEAVQKVLKHKTSGFCGTRPIGEEQIAKCRSQNGYIMAHFQPNYPQPSYPDSFTDEAIIRFCTYSYDTPRAGMPPTEMEKWVGACAKAKREGRPLPPQPIEEHVFKLVEDGKDELGNIKWKKVPGELDYPRPWPRSVVNSYIIACRALKRAMSGATVCGEPAGWTQPPGQLLRQFTGTAEQIAQEAIARARERRVLTTSEKQRILDASLVVDGGIGAPSVLWQLFGGGRRADVERYCKENLSMVNGRIVIGRWQTKNGSSKDVTPMWNFYIMAHYLIELGLWTDENLENGFSPTIRGRILARAGFWEESWEMFLSKEDSRAGEAFGYQAFENDDIVDLPGLVDLLRQHSTQWTAFVWDGFSETEQKALLNYRPSDKGQKELRDVLLKRLNGIMYGGPFHTDQILHGVTLRRRTADLRDRQPTGPNLQYLNRLMLEDMAPEILARRQDYPPNGLRRSGMSAYYQVFESKDATITYFSTGGTSWEEAYKTFYSKPVAREQWLMLYNSMDKAYSQEDRKAFLPTGHKLDDFHTPVIIQAQEKNKILAAEHKQSAPPAVPRRPSGNKHRSKYTPAEKAKWVAEFQKSGTKQKAFAEKHGLVFGVFHRWLEDAGLTQKTRTTGEIAELIAEYQRSGLTRQAFAESKGIPTRTFWTYLQDTGMTKEAVRRSPKDIARLIEEFHHAGMTQKAFAEKHELDVTTLRKYLAESGSHGHLGAKRREEELSDILPNRKFTDEEVAVILAEYDLEEMTQEEFAKSKGIGLKTFGTWLKAAQMTEPRRSKEEIASYIDNFRRSSMTKYAFAKSIGVAPETLHRWLKDPRVDTE